VIRRTFVPVRSSETKERVDAELRGGERPLQLYSWISALEFDGGPLPEGYSLETASLLLRKAWAVSGRPISSKTGSSMTSRPGEGAQALSPTPHS
jgi:hypothetical protein